MKHFEATRAGDAGEEAGLARRQMMPLFGLVAVDVEESRLGVE